MNEAQVEQFSERIGIFRDLWRCVHLTCLAARNSNAWVALAIRVQLAEHLRPHPTAIRPVPDFIAAEVDLPLTSLGLVLRTMVVDGYLPLELSAEISKIYLSRQRAGLRQGSASPSWFGPRILQPPFALRDLGISRTCIALSNWGDTVYEIVSDELLRRIDSTLRINVPVFNGLADLAQRLIPAAKVSYSSSAPIDIVAPVPVDLACTREGQVLVRAPRGISNGILMGKCFFGPTGTQSSTLNLREAPSQHEGDTAQWEAYVDWPPDSSRAKIFLFFREQEVYSTVVNRWPQSGNTRVGLNAYFDPEHVQLNAALLGQPGKDTFTFEMAVARLLNLLGIPIVWYGKGATHSRPDLAACLLEDEEHNTVILGECTRHNPVEKFSPLAERAREVAHFLGGEFGVLPVVFTRAETTESEARQAAEYGISLIGRAELESLLALLGNPPAPIQVVQFLRTQLPLFIPQMPL
jgi:hypothetical protein